MKQDKLISSVWALVLAFCLSFGAVACLISAFHMEVSLWTVALWCAGAALFCCVCYNLPLGLLPVSTLALVSGILWQRGMLKTSFEALLYRLSRQYDKGYGWGIMKLNYLTADDMELQLWLFLCVLGVIIAMLTTWAVCRRKTAVPGVCLAMVLLSACLVVTDTVPGGVYLMMLLFAIIMLMLTNTVRRQDEARGNRVTTFLAIPVVLALSLLFLCVPKNGYTGTEAPRDLMDKFLESDFAVEVLGITPAGTTTGSSVDSSTVNLQTVGVRMESQAEVMQVLTDFDGKLYLRGRALDRYDGVSWSDSGVSTQDLYWPDSQRLADGGEVMIKTRYAHRMLYLPYYVQSKDLSGMTKGLENTKKMTEYSFSCDVLSTDNDFYWVSTQVPYDSAWEEEFSHYLHLDVSVWNWAEDLALEITRGKITVYDRAQAIGDYVRASATYSTNTYRMPSGSKDFVRWFLEDSDTGYCVHFASAATVLLQAAGIPARYVTGYTVDAEASIQKVVRVKDAHAWTEYWLPGFGWTVLEATPAAPEGEGEAQPGGSDAPVQTRPTEPDETVPQTRPNTPGTQQKEEKNALPLVLWCLLGAFLVVAVIAQWRIRVHLRRRRLTRGDTNEQALHCWQEAACLARVLGETPDRQLFSIAEKAKFSPHTITEEELALFHAYFETAQAKLKRRNLIQKLHQTLILAIY